MMKRKSGNSCSSSSSSSSQKVEPHTTKTNNTLDKPVEPVKKPRRVRTGKKSAADAPDTSATSSKSRSSTFRGAYDNEEDAARTYDLAALKYWGPATILNFPVESYAKEIEDMQRVSNEEYLATLRRRSSGFSRGVSKYRGVARHHHNGRWEARIGRVSGNKYLYLGTYSTQEEAAKAYDLAAIQQRGPNAVTNFDISVYADELKKIQSEGGLGILITPPEETPTNKKKSTHDEQPPHEPPMDDAAALVLGPQHEHPWDIYLDTDFEMPQLPEIPFEPTSEDLGWLDCTDFEDDIERIFDGLSFDDGFLQDEGVVDSGLKGRQLSDSLSGSSLSTMASASSEI
ncbi:Ethylene-responsive transcription factor WRI1 [Striga hermonthica]|uniref:Ethylene-responsive transcription factor WRI1 n=1 Tax=Striga hermonthica TaxID=68872 RepID=A0A9N7RN95_STRHE|nr:Ethylene-responsive transcription factor WRI1 [Striga hermonthica]